jgi:hypothetical protein
MSRRALSIALGLLLLLGTNSFAALKQSYVSGNFALELEGAPAGFVTGVDGGFAFGNVVEESESPEYFIKKHLEDPPGYSDITVEIGAAMSPAVYLWIRDVLDGNFSTRKNGAILALNYNNQIVRRVDFSDAHITRVVFPAVNASDKGLATIKLTLTPEATFSSTPGGTYKGSTAAKIKKWNPSNFRFSIKGLDTTRVSSVDAIDISIPRTGRPDASCEICNPVIPQINFPSIAFVGAESFAATWFAWHQSFVLAGQHNDADEKSGTLDYLDSTLQNTLFSLNFTGLGITSIASESSASETILRVRAEAYAEKIQLTLFPSGK